MRHSIISKRHDLGFMFPFISALTLYISLCFQWLTFSSLYIEGLFFEKSRLNEVGEDK